jgi:hypothetical protein
VTAYLRGNTVVVDAVGVGVVEAAFRDGLRVRLDGGAHTTAGEADITAPSQHSVVRWGERVRMPASTRDVAEAWYRAEPVGGGRWMHGDEVRYDHSEDVGLARKGSRVTTVIPRSCADAHELPASLGGPANGAP